MIKWGECLRLHVRMGQYRAIENVTPDINCMVK